MKLQSILSVLFTSCCLASAHAQTLLRSVPGQVGDQFGKVIQPAGDQDSDGFEDLLVGAPGDNGGRGSIHCVSGRYLANGTGASLLWSLAPSLNAGAAFGTSFAMIPDITGNAENDFVVGAPNYTGIGTTTTGAIFLVDGGTHTVAQFIFGFPDRRLGQVVTLIGDQDFDGLPDVAASAPPVNSGVGGRVYFVPGLSWNTVTHNLAALTHWDIGSSSSGFGTAVASLFDLDGDSKFDVAIGSPLESTGGAVFVMKADSSLANLGVFIGSNAERLGHSVDAVHDYNFDGKVDFLVGAPNWSAGVNTEDGRAIVVSGASVLNHSAQVLYQFKEASGSAPTANHLGACVRASGDLDNDGVHDIMVGAPDWHTIFPIGFGKGATFIYSGATGTKIGGLVGANNDHLGDALCGAFQDLDGDGFYEFAVAGTLSDNPAADCGVLKAYRLFPSAPGIYCTAKVNSQGCSPSMSWNGTASASSPSPFLATCTNVINNKSGLLFYSHKPGAVPFQGGLLCVGSPLKRTTGQSSGGSATGTDCTGAFSYDFTPLIQSGGDPSLIAGAQLFCQYWSRDTAAPFGTSLSNALRFLINP